MNRSALTRRIELALSALPDAAATQLLQLSNDVLQSIRHGDESRWSQALESLPEVEGMDLLLDQGVVTAAAPPTATLNPENLRQNLHALIPWRKGPFSICGQHIDSEWRSDWKWDRVWEHLSPLDGRCVLDVGCGNGYYLYRMMGAGARCAVGIDPTLLFLYQFNALQHFINVDNCTVLPLRSDQLPSSLRCFDTVFSMGVLYHRQEPVAHLQELLRALKPGGELVLETLVVDREPTLALLRGQRYARMRNVWCVPTVADLQRWVDHAGFDNARVVSLSLTSVAEQRTTPWMPYESLDQALDPEDSSRTVEGWPAPCRLILVANRPEK